jgi:Spy/CpxP family protein refolding chaperone
LFWRVREQYRDEALGEQIRAAKRALREAVTADVVNEGAIRGLAAQVAPLEAEALIQRAYAHAAVLQVLTPEQRAELNEIQAEAREFGERRRQRRQTTRTIAAIVG